MPTMGNIVVKKADGTTDITYSSVVPSAGDTSPAIWQSQTVGSAPLHYPQLEVKSRFNGAKNARRIDFYFVYPQIATDSTTSLTTVVNKCIAQGTMIVPTGCPAATSNEFAHQWGNLMASASLKAVWFLGYAPS